MINYVLSRAQSDIDEVWFLEHKSIFTLGLGATEENILDPGSIPVLRSDRGGQVTYHGPGQLVAYLLINVRRRKLGVRTLVEMIESAMVAALTEFGISADTRPKAPGVYVKDAKIGALGLRIKNGWSYHGLSLNVKMDLTPFDRINPCGFENLAVTQVANYTAEDNFLLQKVSKVLCNKLLVELGYKEHYQDLIIS